ncbi:DUF1826 domain-containing protein [Roseibium sp. M-1]
MTGLASSNAAGHTQCARLGVRQGSAQDVLIGRDDDILLLIEAPGVAAAIWQRTPDPEFQSWIDALPANRLPEMRTTLPVALAGEAALAACRIAGMPEERWLNMLASDVGALAAIFGRIMKAEYVQIRFDVSDDAMCPKFHLDNVPARLLCTYRGDGTQYVPEVHQTNPARVRNMRTGAVGLFKGGKWPSEERCGLLHRSPAVHPHTGARLLLVIDVADPAI